MCRIVCNMEVIMKKRVLFIAVIVFIAAGVFVMGYTDDLVLDIIGAVSVIGGVSAATVPLVRQKDRRGIFPLVCLWAGSTLLIAAGVIRFRWGLLCAIIGAILSAVFWYELFRRRGRDT